jgi:hypothetical protein
MNPYQLLAMMNAWSRVGNAVARINLSAAEVIARRTGMMLTGRMSAPEAAKMVLEKPVAFAAAAEKAMVAAARGGDAAKVTEAALRPYKTKAAANARRLRR